MRGLTPGESLLVYVTATTLSAGQGREKGWAGNGWWDLGHRNINLPLYFGITLYVHCK